MTPIRALILIAFYIVVLIIAGICYVSYNDTPWAMVAAPFPILMLCFIIPKAIEDWNK